MEQHEKLIKITPDCWHYRLIKYVWGINPKMFMNLCPYFWLTIASIFIVPFIWLFRSVLNIWENIMDSFDRYMNNVFDKELENWLKGLNNTQIIELYHNGFDSIDVKVPGTIKKKTYSWNVVKKWCKMNNIKESDIQDKNNEYMLFKKRMQEERDSIRKKIIEKEEKKNSIKDKYKKDKEKLNKVIKTTKQICGFLITALLTFIFYFIVRLLVWFFTSITELAMLNITDVSIALLIIAVIVVCLFIIYLYFIRISSILDRILNKERASIKEWVISLPALLFFGIFYAIFCWIIYTFLWKWIIYSTYKGFKNAFFTFTGIFGEYFGASYSDYCPGIEWDEDEKSN